MLGCHIIASEFCKSARFQRTSVLKCDEIWKHTLDVWKETSWQAGSAGHYDVRKDYMETETGMVKKPVH